MNNEIEFNHFKDINDLLKNIDSWYREDDIEYTRWFGLTDLYNLKIYITNLQQKVEEKNKEIDRLNNIIDELEKWLKDKQDLTCGCGITIDYLYAYENCLDELKELKKEGK